MVVMLHANPSMTIATGEQAPVECRKLLTEFMLRPFIKRLISVEVMKRIMWYCYSVE